MVTIIRCFWICKILKLRTQFIIFTVLSYENRLWEKSIVTFSCDEKC